MASVAPHITGYRDLELIGRGGFSEVYRAWQEAFDRWVALKVMTFEVHDDRARERFRRECRTTGRFSGHPNVVTVYDADVTPDGRPYLAMQLYEGGSTLGRLQQRSAPLPVDEVTAWTIQVAGALEGRCLPQFLPPVQAQAAQLAQLGPSPGCQQGVEICVPCFNPQMNNAPTGACSLTACDRPMGAAGGGPGGGIAGAFPTCPEFPGRGSCIPPQLIQAQQPGQNLANLAPRG